MLCFKILDTSLQKVSWSRLAHKIGFKELDSSQDYQFLQRSKLPTMYFQKSLPRLPVPHLVHSCDRYLMALKPILSSDQHKQTVQLVKEFQHGVGMDLQALLKQSDNANKHTSYIYEPWFDMYLSDRKPLPINYNPVMVMKPDPRPDYQTQLLRATNLVISSLRFWRSLQEGLLEPEVFYLNPDKCSTAQFRRWAHIVPSAIASYVAYTFKAFPLDMSQYEHLFGVSRLPHLGKDRLVSNKNSKHILVLKDGNLYAVDVLDENGMIVSPGSILGRLQSVVQLNAARNVSVPPLGVLTTLDRDSWACSRKHLHGLCTLNADLLEREVDAALFCLCLDSPNEALCDENNLVPLFKNMLAGYGSNRWFDKSVSLLVSADGTVAVNFEHSWGDGVAVLRYFNEIYRDTIAHPFVHPNTEPQESFASSVRLVNFEVDEKLISDIKGASAKNVDIVDSLEMHMLRYYGINKGFCKNNGVSPDSMMQLSFQLAYRRAFGRYVGSYESCSTAAFRHGRTETIRPCTMAVKKCCEAILNAATRNLQVTELRAMVKQCSKVHSQLTKEAAMGQGFDRHLFGLKHIALKNNILLPDIYGSEPYHKLNYNIISTSTLTSDALLAGAFGPVVCDGLGIGYSINNDNCGAIVTSYRNAGSDGKLFIDSLKQTLSDLHDLFYEKND